MQGVGKHRPVPLISEYSQVKYYLEFLQENTHTFSFHSGEVIARAYLTRVLRSIRSGTVVQRWPDVPEWHSRVDDLVLNLSSI